MNKEWIGNSERIVFLIIMFLSHCFLNEHIEKKSRHAHERIDRMHLYINEQIRHKVEEEIYNQVKSFIEKGES